MRAFVLNFFYFFPALKEKVRLCQKLGAKIEGTHEDRSLIKDLDYSGGVLCRSLHRPSKFQRDLPNVFLPLYLSLSVGISTAAVLSLIISFSLFMLFFKVFVLRRCRFDRSMQVNVCHMEFCAKLNYSVFFRGDYEFDFCEFADKP